MNIFGWALQRGGIALSGAAVVAAVYAGQRPDPAIPKPGLIKTEKWENEKVREWDHPLTSLSKGPDLSRSFPAPQDTTKPTAKDTAKTRYPVSKTDPRSGHYSMDLQNPPSLKSKVKLDTSLKYYKVRSQIDTVPLGDEQKIPFNDYVKQYDRKWMQDYFKKRSLSQTGVQGTNQNFLNKYIGDEGLLGKVGELVEIRPQGSAQLTFSEDWNRVKNPSWSLREQRNSQFKFDQRIQVNVLGNIANRVKVSLNYDTQAAFDFENQKQIKYDGKEDEIIRTIQVGDVSMPVSGSLITGSQSLFGVRTKLQFGKLDVNAVFAQQKSEKKEITLENGAQKNDINISADNYDERRHYFLSQYFREHYNEYNQHWPALSNIQVTRVEVWVTNTNGTPQNTRSLAAFQDLGEGNLVSNTCLAGLLSHNVPDNNANSLYGKLQSKNDARYEKSVSTAITQLGCPVSAGTDYEVLSNARQLSNNEFTYNPRLGYISLNYTLQPGDILAVAFEYTVNGIPHQVGEFSDRVPPQPGKTNVLFLKLLKSTITNTHQPMWKLMMKNIYSLNAYQVQSQDFRLQVVYADDRSGVALNYLPLDNEPAFRNGTPLIRLLQLDRFNTQQERKPDGNFDYLEGVTINSNTGKVIFPVVEPFGEDLDALFQDQTLAKKYVYQELYDSTKTGAQQVSQKNKFFLRGSYRSASGADISLNAINVPQGSVKVFSCGAPLREGVDFIVDYNLGRVKIVNESVLNSGCVIKVEAESKSLFSIQQKTMMGTHLDYHFSKDFTVGGTFLYLRERPLTVKSNVGDDAIRNAIWGLDAHYRTDSRLLTELVDRIPLIQTKEKSEVFAEGEFAQNIPGHAKLQNDPNGKGGVSYLDDFEGSSVPYDLKLTSNWAISAIPQKQPLRFPEAQYIDSLSSGYHRARIAWYTIDNVMFQNSDLAPANIRNNTTMLSDPYMREVKQLEVFPNKQLPQGTPGTLPTFDIMYLPKERGPYNYTVEGLDPNTGNLADPTKSWAGISRKIETTDFEAANIEYLTFWVMDPFLHNKNLKGQMNIDLGTISEDILKDNRESYENGLPKDGNFGNGAVDTTAWGVVPGSGIQHITRAFDTDPNSRTNQDVGYDGLGDGKEQLLYANYVNRIKAKYAARPDIVSKLLRPGNQDADDPSGDDYRYFKDPKYDQGGGADILTRYRLVNNTEGNTPLNQGGDVGYGSTMPDDEDINQDFNLEKDENYFEYSINIDKNSLQKGRNYVTDVQTISVTLPNKTTTNVTWYQFKVPVRQYDRQVGNISDFKSIRFMRMYFNGFADTMIMRFAQLQLVRSDWRKYLFDLQKPVDTAISDPGNTNFDVHTVNLEENGKRPGIPYVLPPGIIRETDYSTPDLIQQNEQSLSMTVCNLGDGDGRAIFKNTQYDVRLYKRIKMFVHAEAVSSNNVHDGDLHLFVRLGTDFSSNYYEYDYPLIVTRSPNSDKSAIWPTGNELDLALQEFLNAKVARNAANYSFNLPYTIAAGGANGKITVLGNPDLGNVRTIMIGIRNPVDNGAPIPCAEVWIDELRVTDMDEKGGWAAVGRTVFKLADFAQVELTGSRRTIGFGSLEQTLLQRSQTDNRTWSVATTAQLGMFLPKRYNVRIPMYYSYAEQINIPRYNPYSPDLPLSTLTNKYDANKQQYDSIVNASEDFTARKSLNFTGVQKGRAANAKKTHIYDIENFTGTYIFSEIYKHNVSYVLDDKKQYGVQLGYNFNFPSKPVTPFTKYKNPNLKLLSDFNFYYLPQSFSTTWRVDRIYGEQLYRNTENYKAIQTPFFDKSFTMGRKYDFRYNLTKSLRLTYTGTATARIQEPTGAIDTREKKDTIVQNLLKLGTLSNFNQSTNIAYDIPINKFPYLDWTTLQTNYTGAYEWQAAPPAAIQLGNIIQNSQTLGWVGQLNFISLYNKNKFFRSIINSQGGGQQPQSKLNPNLKNAGKTGQEEQQPSNASTTKEMLTGLLLSLRSASFNYSVTDGQLLPGFTPTPQVLGQDLNPEAPGWPFVFGSQKDIRPLAVKNGWLTKDTTLSSQYTRSHRENFTGQMVLEPIKTFRINIDFTRQFSRSFTSTFRADQYGNFVEYSPIEAGTFSSSILPIKTAFSSPNSNGNSPVFDRFESYRMVVSERLSKQNPLSGGRIDDSTRYYMGYGPYHQDVLIPAFLAAYTGRKVNDVSLSPFIKLPAPGWRITYSGLSSLRVLQAFVKSLTITHGYHSTYSIANYKTNLEYSPDEVPVENKDLIPERQINSVSISERFEPLFGVDINWANNWTSRFEYRKDRMLSLSFTDRRLTENLGQEYVLGIGYRTNKFIVPFIRRNGNRLMLQNDLNFRLDASIRDNIQDIRILDQSTANSTGGQRLFSFMPDITYALGKSLTLDIFFKRTVTTPHTSNQYPTAFTSVGFKLRYVLTP